MAPTKKRPGSLDGKKGSGSPRASGTHTTKDKNLLQPLTTHCEWGGSIGGFFLVFFLPLLVLSLNSLCHQKDDQCSVSELLDLPRRIEVTVRSALPQLPLALALEVAWLAAHGLFYLLPIGKVIKGMPLRTGETLEYRINAMHAFVVSHVAIFVLHYTGVIRLASLAALYPSLMLGAIIISVVMSLGLYIASYRSSTVLTALSGNSGSFFYDFWVGRELNPRTGFLDWKFYCELRPGLIGWSILNWAFVCQAMELGTVSPSIVLIALFESGYVLDGLLMEAGNLTMMDIVTDGFGFMLCFGDLTWVPFIYTLQTRYLVAHPAHLSAPYLALCCGLVGLGYAIFRGANTQKDIFRSNPKDPRVAHLQVMKTSAGKSLITSGYWGVCRHPNYVGDWLMALGWAALSGTGAALPYFHPLYFGILLLHRQLRDEEHMLAKYGAEDWEAFCNVVRYRLFPYVY